MWCIVFRKPDDLIYYSGGKTLTTFNKYRAFKFGTVEECAEHALAVDEYKDVILENHYDSDFEIHIIDLDDTSRPLKPGIHINEIKFKKLVQLI